jgi:hypothetical protein
MVDRYSVVYMRQGKCTGEFTEGRDKFCCRYDAGKWNGKLSCNYTPMPYIGIFGRQRKFFC